LPNWRLSDARRSASPCRPYRRRAGPVAALRSTGIARCAVALLAGEADGNDTYLEIHAGAGGTESQDWAEMLLRMYTRWAEQRGYKVEMEYQAGEQAGIKSATLLIKGENAYGWLKTESGVHRLVRISPYDSSARRHTSLQLGLGLSGDRRQYRDRDQPESDLQDRHLPRVGRGRPARQHHRFGGAHHPYPHRHRRRLPERPQPAQEPRHRDGDAEGAALRGRSWRKREAAASGEYAAKTDIGWGHQIRSYVLQPYQMVKDLRTGVVTGEKVVVEDVD
jgi:peptide chain release factor 2